MGANVGTVEDRRPDSDQPKSVVTTDFPARLVDNFFRRWFWMLIVIAPFAALGVLSAMKVQDEFVARGSLSASANPLVDQLQVRGANINVFETPAEGTARLFNEQLRTNSFVDEVARRAGLDDELAVGTINRDTIRARVGASEAGDNILIVSSSWGDPETSSLLVNATISGYLDYVAGILARDSDDALDFLATLADESRVAVIAAETELADYLDTLGPRVTTSSFTTVEQFTIERLSAVIDRELNDLNEVENQINDAEIAGAQARTEAFRLLRIIDAPAQPEVPEPNLVSKLVNIVMFTLIGCLVALGVLVLATALDRTIQSAAQLGVVAGTSVIVALPTVQVRRRKTTPGASPPPKRAA